MKSNLLPVALSAEANSNIIRFSSASDNKKYIEELSNMLIKIQLEDDLASSLGLTGETEFVKKIHEEFESEYFRKLAQRKITEFFSSNTEETNLFNV